MRKKHDLHEDDGDVAHVEFNVAAQLHVGLFNRTFKSDVEQVLFFQRSYDFWCKSFNFERRIYVKWKLDVHDFDRM